MDDELRLRIIDLLRRGEDLPVEWAKELFPLQKREYELVYYGKERRLDVVANTMAIPLQPVRTFGSVPGEDFDWNNKLILGDNLQVLRRLLEYKKAGELNNADGSSGIKLVYIDPPFATQREFKGSQEQQAYRDKIEGAQFIEFLRKRLILIHQLLSSDGCIYLHLDYRKVHYAKLVMDEIFGENNLVNEIIWQRTASHNDPGRYGCVHDTILLYSKTSNYIWNAPKTGQSQEYIDKFFIYAESPDGQEWIKLKKGDEPPPGWERYALGNLASPNPRPNLMYKYKGYSYPAKGWKVSPERMQEMDEQGLLHFPPKKTNRIRSKQYLKDTVDNKAIPDVWTDISPIQGQSLEKQNYPTQKPEALLERIIEASSNPGDLVLDCFAGSGTTLAVAEKMGRRWIGIDRGKLAIYTVQKRMLNLTPNIGNRGKKKLEPRPFTLYNAGLYDFSTLQQLPWTDWRFFALELFECKDEPHTIGGMLLDGKRKGASVLVFNHLEQPGTKIDEETILSLHRRIGNKIDHSFYVIAPRSIFTFQQDFLDFDDIRYYALRIPYSFINELHRREFSSLVQPQDETAVNAIVDAEGFDFIEPPTVEYAIAYEEPDSDNVYLQIVNFESRARVKGNIQYGGCETFSMLLADFNYDGKTFDLDEFFYANELEEDGWEIQLPIQKIGEQIMLIFMDIYGNEASVVIKRDEF
jgi:DNA modification methylase